MKQQNKTIVFSQLSSSHNNQTSQQKGIGATVQQQQTNQLKRGNHRRTRSTIPDELNKILLVAKTENNENREQHQQESTIQHKDSDTSLLVDNSKFNPGRQGLYKHSFIQPSKNHDFFQLEQPVITEEDQDNCDIPVVEIANIDSPMINNNGMIQKPLIGRGGHVFVNHQHHNNQLFGQKMGQSLKAWPGDPDLLMDLELCETTVSNEKEMDNRLINQNEDGKSQFLENQSYLIAIQQAKIYEKQYQDGSHLSMNNESEMGNMIQSKLDQNKNSKFNELMHQIELVAQKQQNSIMSSGKIQGFQRKEQLIPNHQNIHHNHHPAIIPIQQKLITKDTSMSLNSINQSNHHHHNAAFLNGNLQISSTIQGAQQQKSIRAPIRTNTSGVKNTSIQPQINSKRK